VGTQSRRAQQGAGRRGPGGLLDALRRPEDLVPRTRWLFLVFAVLALLMSLPGPLTVAGRVTLPALLGASAVLVTSWTHAYLSGRESLLRDVADCLAITTFTLTCPAPAMVFSVTFCALWFHAVHSTTRRGLLRCVAYGAAVAAALPLWGVVPGHEPSTQAAPVFGTAPVMLLTFVVVRVLAQVMFARERAAQRDALLVGLGTTLLRTGDAAGIAREGVATSQALCAATPGLRSLTVRRADGHLEVVGAAGAFAHAPGRLPADVVPPALPAGVAVPVPRAAELDAAAGEGCRWVCLDLPGVDGVSVLVGAPGRLEPDVVVSFQSLANQVALAVGNARVHRLLSLQARTDALTGLANRAGFHEALAACAGEGDVALVFVDLDGFKAVNDRFGHGAGDELLRHVATSLLEVTRPEDVCARLGGDEFAVLLRGAGAEEAAAVGRRIADQASVPVRLSRGEVRVGASVGTASATGPVDPEELLDRADTAMYAAKTAGRGRVAAPALTPGGA